MAITIKSSAQSPAPVFNAIPFVVSSTNSGQTNFKFVCDVYVSGVTGYSRLLLNADPTTGYAAFLVNNILRSQVSSDFDYTSGVSVLPFKKNTHSYVAYECKFGEQYGASGSIVTYPNLTVTGTELAFNGSLDPITWNSYTSAAYTISSTSSKFLDNDYGAKTFRLTDRGWLNYYCATSGNDKSLIVKTYNFSGALTMTASITNNYNVKSSSDDKFIRVGVAPVDINISSPNLINSAVLYYTIWLADSGATQTSETRTFFVNQDATNSEEYIVAFKNDFGGMDTLAFYRKSKRTSSITRKTYQKNVGGLSGSTWSYNNYDAGEITMDTKIQDSYLLNSNWITNNQAKWLKQLVTSPEVYVYDPDILTWVRCNVTDSNYEVKKSDNDKQFNLVLNLKKSQISYRQNQ